MSAVPRLTPGVIDISPLQGIVNPPSLRCAPFRLLWTTQTTAGMKRSGMMDTPFAGTPMRGILHRTPESDKIKASFIPQHWKYIE